METFSVNSFEIPDKAYSHPDCYPLSRHAKNIAASFSDESHKIAALFHDLGKLNRKFQHNIINGGKLPFHALEGALFFLAWCGMRLDVESFAIFLSVIKHHGNLEDVQALADDLTDEDTILHRHPDLHDSIRDIIAATGLDIEFDLESCCEIFDSEFFVKENRLDGLASFFRIRELFSELVFADKFEAIFKDRFRVEAEIQPEKYRKTLLEIINSKKNSMSFVRNAARQDVMAAFEANREKRIFFIEAPTGIGKTFISLQLALEIAAQKKMTRIICALPMTSIIDQTHMEYSRIIDQKSLLKFHHLTRTKGYVNINSEEKSETGFYLQKNDFLGASWCMDHVIVTTFNQILNAFYSNRNRDLVKFHTLRDSVVIFDEVQAIPRIFMRDFARTVEFLSENFNMNFILMSATIPAIRELIPKDKWSALLDPRYYEMEFNNRYRLAYRKEINSVEKLVEQIRLSAEKNTSLLCVVNTKKLALELYERVKEFSNPDDLFLLSALFIPKHRRAIIRTIRKRLASRQKTILISTQVIEAGVDLDFDYGFREFAPFYSIIQTAGRINRENRRAVRETATLVITDVIGNSPYHPTDLLNDEVAELLETDIRENEILPKLRDYFKIAISRTRQEPVLIESMKLLEFQTVMKKFDKNFMKTLPNICPVFIEVRRGMYDRFISRRNRLIELMKEEKISLEETMEIRSRLKRISKYISGYVINVSRDDAQALPDFENYGELKVCQFPHLENGVYSVSRGWSGISSSIMF